MNVYSITWSQSVAEGLLIGCVPIGGGIGALSSYYLLKKFSRKSCILIVNCFAFVIGFILFIPNAYMLLFVRFLQGMCAGLFSSITPLIMK
jgi:predicted MFS family arabinose efflux permease